MKALLRLLPALAVLALVFSISAGVSASSANDRQAQEEAQGWTQFLERYGPSHASGQRPDLGPTTQGNPTNAVTTLRIGLRYSYTPSGSLSEFYSVNHPFVKLSNTSGSVRVVDLSTGKQVATMQAGQEFDVRYDGTGYVVSGPGGAVGTFVGPIRFVPNSPDNLFAVDSIRRIDIITYSRYLTPMYRGQMEVARGSATPAGMVNLVNILGLEDYIRGVVVNESPAFFALEALKAQAVAARGYAVANIGRWEGLGYPFDLDDSPSSQVYRGETSEHPRGDEAVDGTEGLVASYQGDIISAFYSSSMGGHTESVEWIFNQPPDQLPGTNAVPYLKGIYDGPGTPPDLSTEQGIRDFWTNPQPQTYDSCELVNNRFARWVFSIPADVIKERLVPGRYVVVSGSATGDVTNVEVTQRMPSGRVAVARITLTGGVVDVRGWDNLRRVLGATASSTPDLCTGRTIPANFVLNNPSVVDPYYNPDGSFAGVKVYGGGWGHNVGMSQYGADGRGLSGQNFIQILQAYYTGVDIGSYPISINAAGSGPHVLRQQFATPTGKGVLEVRAQGMKGLNVTINGTYQISLTQEQLSQPVVELDISRYLEPGTNTIQYAPVGNTGTATVLVVVS